MLDDLTKTFFDTFGVEPKIICSLPPKNRDEFCRKYIRCPECTKKTEKYPITDRQYLELISAQLRVDKLTNVTFAPNNTHTSTIKGLQDLILGGSILCYETLLKNNFIKTAEDYKHQVQAIFEGER